MDGRGTGAEESLNRKNRRQKERNGSEDQENAVDVRNDFQGELRSVVPDEIYIPLKKDDVETPRAEDTRQMLTDLDRLKTMDIHYRTLFAEGGFEALRDIADGDPRADPGMMGAEDYDSTLELLSFHGMIDRDGENTLTDFGEAVYSNWRGFEDYLVSDERIQDIEKERGDQNMPDFMASWGIETDLDAFLRDREGHRRRWQKEHSPTGELYEITRALYPEPEDFGYGLIALEYAKNGEPTDTEPLSDAGVRGLLERDGLNQDGEKLYNKVLADYLLG